MPELKVFSAGVAGKLARKAAEVFAAKNPDVQVDLQMGGSAAGVNRLLAGEAFDVLILADASDIATRLMPELVDGYFIWGGNAMVVVGADITPENWAEKLCDPASIIEHGNPFDDPGGYRSVMALKLADQVEPGLSERLFANPGYTGLDRSRYVRPPRPAGPPAGGTGGERPRPPKPEPPAPGRYRIIYRSMPVSTGLPFADLPACMNLGDPAYEDVYRSVSFMVDGPAGECTEEVRGTTICHGVCIPKAAANPEAAAAFVAEFLKSDFAANGFTPVQRAEGNWQLTCDFAKDERKDEPVKTYRDFLPQLVTMPEFLGIEGEDIIKLLEAMKPELVCRKVGEEGTPDNGPDVRRNLFCIRLTGEPIPAPEDRDDRYQNPGFTNCGMMMGEIPSFSCMFQNKSLPVKPGGPGPKGMPKPPAPTEDIWAIRFSPEQFTTFVPEVAEAQGKMIRNFMGMLAQKVTDHRKIIGGLKAEIAELKGEAE